MAHPPGECAGVECTVDLGTQFCERCGRDRDSFASVRNAYRDCPACGAACCADCWNLVDGACLACAPFRLVAATARPRIVIAPEDLAGSRPTTDPYADLRGGEPARGARRASAAYVTAPLSPRRKRRRAGRIGLAAGAAWIVVAALAVVALGASPRANVPRSIPASAPAGPAQQVVNAAPEPR